jgi:MFS family permease
LICLLVFAFSDYIPNKEENNLAVNILHIVSQFVNGFCCGGQITIGFSYVSQFYPNRMQEITSYLDSGIVLGMTSGLSLGGVMYALIENYAVIYFIMTGIQLILIFPLMYFIPADKTKTET